MKDCFCCGGSSSKTIFRWMDTEGNITRVDKCLKCGLLYQDPMPVEKVLHQLYNEEYFSVYERYYIDFRTRQFREDVKRINILNNNRTGRLLDIGCAFGLFMNEAKRVGWDVYGVDVSKNAVEYARKKYGLSIFLGTLKDASFEDRMFDVITAWDVIEHLTEPVSLLDESSKIIKKGGILAIRTPNADSLFLTMTKIVNSILGDRFAKIVVNFIKGNFRDSKQALLLIWIHIRYKHERIK